MNTANKIVSTAIGLIAVICLAKGAIALGIIIAFVFLFSIVYPSFMEKVLERLNARVQSVIP